MDVLGAIVVGIVVARRMEAGKFDKKGRTKGEGSVMPVGTPADAAGLGERQRFKGRNVRRWPTSLRILAGALHKEFFYYY